MASQSLFKWRQFLPEIILLNVRWYCRYPLSYRNLEEMMAERGVEVDHSTINRWVLKFAPELDQRLRPHLSLTNDSCRVDETYLEVKGKWKYLYRAVNSAGNTLDFLLSALARREGSRKVRFLGKVLKAEHAQAPRVSRDASCEALTVDKNAA
jgi:transposase-like protein